jgi:aromatic-L-amino-acid/L-tryptophan decarboxylase
VERNDALDHLRNRQAPIELSPEAFRTLAHQLVDHLAGFLVALPDRQPSMPKSPSELRALLPDGLPAEGTDVDSLLRGTLSLLEDHQIFNGHPGFMAYITAPASPVGMLADFIVSTLNPNVGLWGLSPIATEIELQTAAWIAELIGYPSTAGVMSSGGQVANFIGLLVGRQTKTPWNIHTEGIAGGDGQRLRVYSTREAHNWLRMAVDLFGLGLHAIHWIDTRDDLTMDCGHLEQAIAEDKQHGDHPLLVIGTAGSVGTGAIDPLPEIAQICRRHDLWFHVDGAYGALAAALPDAPPALLGLREADSVAVDPHKWLYAPIDAGCTLVRDVDKLTAAFGQGTQPSYYVLGSDESARPLNLFAIGPENSRRFRAFKVWLQLQVAGRDGYCRMIADDIALAQELHRLIGTYDQLEPRTLGLSIVTFRYVPTDLRANAADYLDYLNRLNQAILARLQVSGTVYLSNSSVGGAFMLRSCIVNFRTTLIQIEALPPLVVEIGNELDRELRPSRGGDEATVAGGAGTSLAP